MVHAVFDEHTPPECRAVDGLEVIKPVVHNDECRCVFIPVVPVEVLKPACDVSKDGLHCGHWGGGVDISLGDSSTGSYGAYCCHCGERTQVPWRENKKQRPGHGVHCSDMTEETTWPEGWKGQ